jgi:hypothetical protein
MKKIFIVSIFGNLSSNNNSRLASIYTYTNAEKKIITPDFDHTRKKYKKELSEIDVTYLHVPPYKKNLSLQRLYSHLCFAYQLKKYLKKITNKPDMIYCAMPTSTAAYVCGKYCKKNKIFYIIDVVDLWPDSLLPINKVYKIFNPFSPPWKYITIKAYQLADIIIGESKKYVQIASSYNSLAPAYTIYLGIDIQQIERLRNESNITLKKPNNELWICYAGSLGNSYDFSVLLHAVRKLDAVCKYTLLFVGDGDQRDFIEKKMNEFHINGHITGFLSYSDYLKYLSYCDIGINIFKKDTLVIHSYKFNDYVASNLFILNSLSGETAEIIDTYKIGKNFNFSDNLLCDVLKEVCESWNIYSDYRSNNTKVINEILDKNIIYPRVLANIINS